MSLQNLTFSSLALDGTPFLALSLSSSPASLAVSGLTVSQSSLTDFLRVDNADSFTATALKFDQIDGSTQGAATPAAGSALLSVTGANTVAMESVQVTSSTLMVSSAILIDGVANVRANNGIFQSVKVQNADLMVVKKPTSLTLSNT